ncbi:MAG: HAD family hydrolase [Bacilli bacterium]|nr:HAD family hydrolase [Bacilli bacterium]
MKTIIFDLDGTILNTLEDLKNAVNYGLKSKNLPEKDLKFVRKAIGNGTQVLIKRCTPESISDEERQIVFNIFKSYYLKHYADNTKPYPGITELLKSLKGKCQLAVVSNKDDDLTKKLINKEFPGMFDIIQGSYLDKPKKPHPFLINKIIEDYSINNADCLYIGDTEIDKESAENAGLDYLLVNYGYRTKEELEKICPNDISYASVDSLLNRILMWVNL